MLTRPTLPALLLAVVTAAPAAGVATGGPLNEQRVRQEASVARPGLSMRVSELPGGEPTGLAAGDRPVDGKRLGPPDHAVNPADLGSAGPRPLSPPSSGRGTSADGSNAAGMLSTVFGSLAVVVGLFLLIAWFTRRQLPKTAARLPQEVVEVLGRAPLAGRHQMHLVRVGNKLLIVSLSPAGAETLGEIDDADEVARLAALCRANPAGTLSENFREVISQLGGDASPGRARRVS